MGAPELWRILVSLVGAGLAFGAVLAVARLLRFDPSRLPKHWIPPAVTLFMMMTSVALLLTLVPRGPQRASAGAEVEERPRSLATSPWRFRVYQLENWGEIARRMGAGEQFSRNMLEELKALGASVRRGAENDLPLDLYENGRRPSSERLRHFMPFVPFMCVSGRVSRTKDGRFEATVELHEIDRRVRSKKLWSKTAAFRGTDQSSLEAAREVVSGIAARARAEAEGVGAGN